MKEILQLMPPVKKQIRFNFKLIAFQVITVAIYKLINTTALYK